MNILLCGNDIVYTGMELVVYSLLTHNKNVNIYIFTMDVELDNNGEVTIYRSLTEWQRNKLKKIVRYLDGGRSNLSIIDTYEDYVKYLKGGANDFSGFTPYAGLRLIVDKVIPEIDDILYLDSDTTIQGDISSMYYSMLESNPDYDYYASFAPDACDHEGEMVSGVVLFNLKRIRQTGFLTRSVENFKKHEYIYPDQMAMRDAGTAFPLPESYGYMYPLETCFYTPRILHFTNQLSPKIYDSSPGKGRNYFYKRYPQFEYVKKGCEMLDTLDIRF